MRFLLALFVCIAPLYSADKTQGFAPSGPFSCREPPRPQTASSDLVPAVTLTKTLSCDRPKTSPTATATTLLSLIGGSAPFTSTWVLSHPLPKTMLSSALVSLLGSLCSQALTRAFSFTQSLTFTLIGGCYFGPILFYWYGLINWLGDWIEKRYAPPKSIKVLAQLVVNQSAGAVLINIGFLLFHTTLTSLLSPDPTSLSSIIPRAKLLLPSALKANWSIWPAASYINFYFVPREKRVLFTQVVAVAYNFVLSLVAVS